jgi:hypothetical protein
MKIYNIYKILLISVLMQINYVKSMTNRAIPNFKNWILKNPKAGFFTWARQNKTKMLLLLSKERGLDKPYLAEIYDVSYADYEDKNPALSVSSHWAPFRLLDLPAWISLYNYAKTKHLQDIVEENIQRQYTL